MNNIEVPRNLGFSTIVGKDGWYVIAHKQRVLVKTSYPFLAGMINSFYLDNLVYLYESN